MGMGQSQEGVSQPLKKGVSVTYRCGTSVTETFGWIYLCFGCHSFCKLCERFMGWCPTEPFPRPKVRDLVAVVCKFHLQCPQSTSSHHTWKKIAWITWIFPCTVSTWNSEQLYAALFAWSATCAMWRPVHVRLRLACIHASSCISLAIHTSCPEPGLRWCCLLVSPDKLLKTLK